MGTYELAVQEESACIKRVELVLRTLDASLELALRRLSDASLRRSPRDKLLDAAIGLEAILLTDGPPAELRYRFSLRYAVIGADDGDRVAAFRRARKIYDSRSTVAHGERVDDEKIAEDAEDACGMLRMLLNEFLPYGRQPPYSQKDYWERRILAVKETSE